MRSSGPQPLNSQPLGGVQFEIVRNSKDKLIELAEIKELETPHEPDSVKSPLLEAFVAGYRVGTAGMN